MKSKNTIKLIKSLVSKKNRIKENLFLVEGDKNVSEVLNSGFIIEKLYGTSVFLNQNKVLLNKANSVIEVSEEEIKKASLLKTPQNSLALCSIPPNTELPEILTDNLNVYLDGIQDPGNLGTIIRTCDWFGIQNLYCSADTADVFNPKVIQASMGSFCRVKVLKTSFFELAEIANKSDITILGTFLDGKNIYNEMFPSKVLIIMGNEGNGIRGEIESKIHEKIMIPSFKEKSNGAESLNVSVATAIICSEFKRRENYSK